MTERRAVVLVDGEHYPPVLRAALASLRAQGTTPLAALFLGGTEKVARHGADVDLGTPVHWVPRGTSTAVDVGSAADVLVPLLAALRPDVVVDLSDEPVLDSRRRLQLASHVLVAGVAYEAPGMRLEPPPRPRVATLPSLAVVGVGKRTGKTAVAGDLTRRLAGQGRTPVVVAMGRGGPPEPVVVRAGTVTGVADLLAVADAGGHAASDFYEDAITSGAATVGAHRCGGGPAGAVAHSNVPAAVQAAGGLGGDLLVLEGSGAALPPVHADATVLVVPGDADPELLAGYLGPYRVLLADLVVVTLCGPPRSTPSTVTAVLEAIRSTSRRTPLLRTVFRPFPLGPIEGRRVFLASTAPASATASMAAELEADHGCEVVATSAALADRPALRAHLEQAPAFDVLLVELKAAAVDVAARVAASVGTPVVICDHRPVVVGVGDDAVAPDEAEQVLEQAVGSVAGLAERRFAAR